MNHFPVHRQRPVAGGATNTAATKEFAMSTTEIPTESLEHILEYLWEDELEGICRWYGEPQGVDCEVTWGVAECEQYLATCSDQDGIFYNLVVVRKWMCEQEELQPA